MSRCALYQAYICRPPQKECGFFKLGNDGMCAFWGRQGGMGYCRCLEAQAFTLLNTPIVDPETNASLTLDEFLKYLDEHQ